ncbi:MAG: hypothetical protein MK010_03905 [Erythrobacter sp.]|nr:hypothetical protein [Erythrobacter sp.]
MIGALLSTDFAERRARDGDARLARGLPGPFPFGDREVDIMTEGVGEAGADRRLQSSAAFRAPDCPRGR